MGYAWKDSNPTIGRRYSMPIPNNCFQPSENKSMKYEMPEKWVEAVNAGKVDEIMDCYEEHASVATFEARPLKSFEGSAIILLDSLLKKVLVCGLMSFVISRISWRKFLFGNGSLRILLSESRQLGSTSRSFYFYDKTDSGEKIIHHHLLSSSS